MNSNYPRLLGLQTPWVWVQPRGTEDILRRLAEARDYAVHVQERENLCSVAYGEIVRLLAALRDPVAEPVFATGDVVQAIPLSLLRSGSRQYADAVVVSVNPLVLVSREGDMCWSVTVNDMKLLRVGRIDGATLAVCMSRYVRDYTAFTPLHPESVELDLLPGFPRKVIATGSVNVTAAPAEPTPRTDEAEVDLNECISVQTLGTGRRVYVEKYVPADFARTLEREHSAQLQRNHELEVENAALREALADIAGGHNVSAKVNAAIELGDSLTFQSAMVEWCQATARAALPAEKKGT